MNRGGARSPFLTVVTSGALYFALVFGAGFILGPIRILWAVPRFGTRVAEFLEMPIMLGVIVVAARWIVGRFGVPSTVASRLGMGCLALGLLLAAEFTLVLRVRGMSYAEYLADRDPVSGTVYYLLLGVFALMPVLVRRR